MQSNLRKTVERTIEHHSMLLRGDRVLVAFSGGPDSVCLLDILEELREKYSLTIRIAHFNHNLRGEASDKDAEFAEKIARRKGLAFITSSADVRGFAGQQKLSIEEAARTLRYEFLLSSSLSLGADKVAVGHTADDQAETVLMRLIRGSGPHGLEGMPPARRLGNSDQPMLIRPLIDIWRRDILRHIKTRRLRYRTDASNESTEYLRNRIRLDLLPYLEEKYNPQIRQRLASAASALAIENDFIETEARLLAGEITTERKPGCVVFDAALFASLPLALRKRILFALVSSVRERAPMLEAVHYNEVEALLCASKGKLDLPGKLRLEISEGAGLISEAAYAPGVAKGTFSISINGATIIPELNVSVKTKVMDSIASPSRLIRLCTPGRQYFDLDAVRPPLEVRIRRPGDSLHPLGARGKKKIKDYFIDKKIPRFLRDHIPLLLSNGRVMWVMGHAIDRKFMLKPGSRAALRVDYERQ